MNRPTETEVLEELKRLLVVELGLRREIKGDQEIAADLQLDSVGVLTLVVGLENRFRIRLDESDAAHVRTVSDLVALVRDRAAWESRKTP